MRANLKGIAFANTLRNVANELTALRAKVAAGAKLRRACDELPELTYFDDNPKERTSCLDCGAEIIFGGETRHGGSCSVSLFKYALDEYDACK